ncbi:hypothetical protein KY290_033735 [Solanum tuberosum]|uniref:Uncharacterized protein n=1 Tax=Solanum tuberosum TaxID=4113 RepID=A0ABQ7U173_SOLTU|nr:hypothetical protein KY290_033735 [Solanum tuberosum]
MAKSEGEHSNTMSDDDIPLTHFVPKRVRSQLLKGSGKPVGILMDDPDDDGQSTPSVAVPVKVTGSVKRSLEEGFVLMNSKKPHCFVGKSSCNVTPIDSLDDSSEFERPSRNRKHPSSKSLKKQVKKGKKKTLGKITKKNGKGHREISSESEWENKSGDEGVHEKQGEDVIPENIDDNIDSCNKRILNFTQRKVIRGRVFTGFGGAEMGELLSILHAQGWTDLFLQGNTRRKMVSGKHITLTPDVIAQILGIPNIGWCHYVKRNWPPLDGLPSALDIIRKFSHDPTVEEYSRIYKGAMLPLQRLLFDVVHKIILPRGQKRTEANYLDLTLMELLISRRLINLTKLMLFHMDCICVEDKKLHSLGYGFWLGEIFEYFKVHVKEWQVQTTKNVLGTVNQVIVPALRRGANAPLQRLHTQLALKDEEIAALRASHSAAMDQLYVSYGLEHSSLVEENSKLKDEFAKAAAALEADKSTNSANLKGLFDLFKTTNPGVSLVITNLQPS